MVISFILPSISFWGHFIGFLLGWSIGSLSVFDNFKKKSIINLKFKTMSNFITRVLIANRGEIARRIIRSAHAMGIGSVAVYADGDAGEPFVREANQAVALGGRNSAETYLDTGKVLAAAKRTGADAVHPGYGFLAENGRFARAVIEAGLIWIGPSPEAITP